MNEENKNQDYKPYNPIETEPEIYKLWENSGYFNPDKLPSPQAGQAGKREEKFVIMLPPPNITGSLHMGHALEHSLSDVLIRWKRMQGYKSLWLPGTDHAGIATQYVVEKELKKESLTKNDLGREAFLKRVWQWKEKYGNTIIEQMKKLGNSLDWSRLRFTMDEQYSRAVKEAFNHYHKKGWVYQAPRVVNWCPRCATSLSDLEIEYKQEQTELIYIRYPLVGNSGYITIATVRVETMLGDAAVAVHPQDKRYQKLIGKKVILPIQEREIPIVGDEAIDPNFGSGAVKVTPSHDKVDFEIAQRHNLPQYNIIDERGKMTKESKVCEGLNVLECRKKVVEILQQKGLIEKKESIEHNLAICYRCATTIEPIISKQWFLKMKELAEKAKEAVKKGKIHFATKRFEKTYFNWLDNIHDWTISRQLWWGHKIPLEGVTDVLDTWFSSALWPFATLGWPDKTKDLKEYYQTTVMTSDRGILHLWITRMIFSGLEFMNEIPFKTIYIHPTVLLKTGERMSKSKGTGIDPIDLIERYGADATRFGLLWLVFGGQDIRFGEESAQAGKKFANKIWNAGRFILMQLEKGKKYELKWPKQEETQLDKDIKKEFASLIEKTDKNLASFEFGDALHNLYDFFWKRFADVYLEDIKNRKNEYSLQRILMIYATLLKLLHPFIPFVTETIYTKLPIENKSLLLVENWPTTEEFK